MKESHEGDPCERDEFCILIVVVATHTCTHTHTSAYKTDEINLCGTCVHFLGVKRTAVTCDVTCTGNRMKDVQDLPVLLRHLPVYLYLKKKR